MMRSGLQQQRRISAMAVLAGAYFVFSLIGMAISIYGTGSASIWPASGVAVGGLLLLGWRNWPALFVGSFVAIVGAAGVQRGAVTITGLLLDVLTAAGVVAEAVLAAWLFDRVATSRSHADAARTSQRPPAFFDTIRDVYCFAVICPVASLASALVGPVAAQLGGLAGGRSLSTMIGQWWLGDMIGMLVITPLMTTLVQHRAWRATRAEWLERMALFTAVLVASVLIFVHLEWAKILHGQTYALLPLFLWAAVRLGTCETMLAIVVASTFALGHLIVHATSPTQMDLSLLQVQMSIGVTCETMLLLTVALAERKRFVATVAELNERLQDRVQEATDALVIRDYALAHSITGIVFGDMQGVVTYANKAFCQLIGYDSPDDVVGRPAQAFSPDYPQVEQILAELHQAGSFAGEVKGVRPDGSSVEMQVNATMVRDVDEKPICLMATMVDISPQKQALQELRSSEARNRALVSAIPDMMFRVDRSGKFLDFVVSNPELLIAPPEYFMGRTMDEVLPRHIASTVTPAVSSAIATGQMQIVEYSIAAPLPAAETRYFESRIVRSGDDEAIAIVRDISSRKQAEREREEMITQLELKNAELERFSYTASHDLKSPLISIRGFMDFLRRDLAAGQTAAIEEDLRQIGGAIHRMQELLDQLLELSRAGRPAGEKLPVSLGQLVREATDLVRGNPAAQRVAMDVPDELPEVWGDRTRLRVVLQNLFENASKFMGEQQEPRIRVSAEVLGDEVICRVSDNGIGIAPDCQTRIFGIFEKLNPHVEGTGMGLAICRRIIEAHAGRIWVESAGAGQGSTFAFSLLTPKESGSG